MCSRWDCCSLLESGKNLKLFSQFPPSLEAFSHWIWKNGFWKIISAECTEQRQHRSLRPPGILYGGTSHTLIVLGTSLCPDQVELELTRCEAFENPVSGDSAETALACLGSNEKCNILLLPSVSFVL